MTSKNQYTDAHIFPSGTGDARPTALDIVKDQNLQGKLSGKVILITGAWTGIGVETVRALCQTGATVFAAVRNLEKARNTLAGIESLIKLITLDLASLGSVRAAAKDFLEQSGGRLKILVNNAGVISIPTRTLTEDGFEAQFGTNHLRHFLFFQLLKAALLESLTPSFNSRVIVLSSSAHKLAGIRPKDYNLDDGSYNEWTAYGQAKTANLYMSNAIERCYGSMGLHALAVHPGVIMTELTRHLDPSVVEGFQQNATLVASMKSIQQGAATTVLAAIGKEYEGVGGKYLENAGEMGPANGAGAGEMETRGYGLWAFDPALEDQLWKDSNRFVGIVEYQNFSSVS